MTDTKRVSREPTPEQIMAWHNERRYGPQDGTPAAEPDVERERLRRLLYAAWDAVGDDASIAILRTYGEECRAAERERCAKICEDYAEAKYGDAQMMTDVDKLGLAIREARHD